MASTLPSGFQVGSQQPGSPFAQATIPTGYPPQGPGSPQQGTLSPAQAPLNYPPQGTLSPVGQPGTLSPVGGQFASAQPPVNYPPQPGTLSPVGGQFASAQPPVNYPPQPTAFVAQAPVAPAIAQPVTGFVQPPVQQQYVQPQPQVQAATGAACPAGELDLQSLILVTSIQLRTSALKALAGRFTWEQFANDAVNSQQGQARDAVIRCLQRFAPPVDEKQTIQAFERMTGLAPYLATFVLNPPKPKPGQVGQNPVKFDFFPMELFGQKPRLVDFARPGVTNEEAEESYKSALSLFYNKFPYEPRDLNRRINKLEKLFKALLKISRKLDKLGASSRNPLRITYNYSYSNGQQKSVTISSDQINGYIEYLFRVAVSNIRYYFKRRGGIRTISSKLFSIPQFMLDWIGRENFVKGDVAPMTPLRAQTLGVEQLTTIVNGPLAGTSFFTWLANSVVELIQQRYQGVYQSGDYKLTAAESVNYYALRGGVARRGTVQSLIDIAIKTAGLQNPQDRRLLAAQQGSPMAQFLNGIPPNDYKRNSDGSIHVKGKSVKGEVVQNTRGSSLIQILSVASQQLSALKAQTISYDANGIAKVKRQNIKNGQVQPALGSIFTLDRFDYAGVRRIPSLILTDFTPQADQAVIYNALAELEEQVIKLYSSSFPVAEKTKTKAVVDANKLPKPEVIIQQVMRFKEA